MRKIFIIFLLLIPTMLFAEIMSYDKFLEKSARQEDNKTINKAYYDGIEFLRDAFNAGILTREDLETLTPQAIANKLKLDFDVFGQSIIDYQKSRVKGYTVPRTERYLRNYNYYLEGIATGRINNKNEIIKAYHNGDIHPSDYQELLDKFNSHANQKSDMANSLVKKGTKYVFAYIDVKIKDTNAAMNLKYDIEDALRHAIADGRISNELEAMEYTKKYYNFLVQPEYVFR